MSTPAKDSEPLTEFSDYWVFDYHRARILPQAPFAQGEPFNLITTSLYWPLVLFSILPIIIYARRFHRWHRTRDLLAAGRCAHCGYGLRASPKRCPECGQPIPTHV